MVQNFLPLVIWNWRLLFLFCYFSCNLNYIYIYIKRKRERTEKDELLFLESALVKCVRILRQRVVFILSWCCFMDIDPYWIEPCKFVSWINVYVLCFLLICFLGLTKRDSCKVQVKEKLICKSKIVSVQIIPNISYENAHTSAS